MTVNGQEYKEICLLGKGKGGYSYLVEQGGKRFVLKQIHHEPCDYYQFGDKFQSELQDYERLWKIGIPMPQMLAVDVEQERILKEYIAGKTAAELVEEDGITEAHIAQVRTMCEKLYAANLNIDYFPTNFVERDGILYYIDYECNAYMQQWDFEHWGIKYWSKTQEFLDYFK